MQMHQIFYKFFLFVIFIIVFLIGVCQGLTYAFQKCELTLFGRFHGLLWNIS